MADELSARWQRVLDSLLEGRHVGKWRRWVRREGRVVGRWYDGSATGSIAQGT